MFQRERERDHMENSSTGACRSRWAPGLTVPVPELSRASPGSRTPHNPALVCLSAQDVRDTWRGSIPVDRVVLLDGTQLPREMSRAEKQTIVGLCEKPHSFLSRPSACILGLLLEFPESRSQEQPGLDCSLVQEPNVVLVSGSTTCTRSKVCSCHTPSPDNAFPATMGRRR